MSADYGQRLRQEFDLMPPMAVWIVVSHIFVLACPLLLIWAVDNYSDLLVKPFAHATLIHIASAIYIGATAFEVAQNSADRWYLTEATRSVADLFFNSFMTLAFWIYTVAFLGLGWVASAAGALTMLYPFAYIWNHPSHRSINGTVVLIATAGLFAVTGDPATFLFMIGNGVGVFFITFVVKQRAQVLHGWAAFAFGLGFLSWPWSIRNAANGTQLSWITFAGVVGVIGVLLGLLAPVLRKAKATPRRYA
jgi:hypothetical protein